MESYYTERVAGTPPVTLLEVHAMQSCEAFYTAGFERGRIAVPEVQR